MPSRSAEVWHLRLKKYPLTLATVGRSQVNTTNTSSTGRASSLPRQCTACSLQCVVEFAYGVQCLPPSQANHQPRPLLQNFLTRLQSTFECRLSTSEFRVSSFVRPPRRPWQLPCVPAAGRAAQPLTSRTHTHTYITPAHTTTNNNNQPPNTPTTTRTHKTKHKNTKKTKKQKTQKHKNTKKQKTQKPNRTKTKTKSAYHTVPAKCQMLKGN